jgi:type IV pilus assembly protein PilE
MQVRQLRFSSIQSGFTLVELMIVVAIIGILTAVAVPAYTDYVRRGQIPDAMSALADARIKMEQYYQDNRSYGATDCAGGALPTSAGKFTISCTSGGQTYTVTATGASGAAVGHVYTLNQDNVRKTTKFKGSAIDKSCWLIKGSEC